MKKTDKALKAPEYQDPFLLIYGPYKISNKQITHVSLLESQSWDLSGSRHQKATALLKAPVLDTVVPGSRHNVPCRIRLCQTQWKVRLVHLQLLRLNSLLPPCYVLASAAGPPEPGRAGRRSCGTPRPRLRC